MIVEFIGPRTLARSPSDDPQLTGQGANSARTKRLGHRRDRLSSLGRATKTETGRRARPQR
jgi:hypothetical protein